MQVLVEARVSDGWVQVGAPVAADGPCGSLSSDGPGGRQVYVFGFRDGQPGVWRSTGGMDIETPVVRVVVNTAAGLERLSDLAEPYQVTLRAAGHERTMRFRVVL